MKRPNAAALALLLMAAGTAASAADQPSRAIYPLQRLELHYRHDVHLRLAVVGCEDCHPAAQSTRAADRLIPGHPACGKCHQVRPPEAGAKVQNTCALCHPGWTEGGPAPRGVSIPTAWLHFDHAAHLRRGARCETCHPDVPRLGLATREELPRMETCFACHDDRQASRACATCHLEGTGGKVRTEYPGGLLTPGEDPLKVDHDAGWVRAHALPGSLRRETCLACHTEKSCLDCHDGVFRPFGIHPAGWIDGHVVAARQDELSCRGCHRGQSYCATCHERVGLGPDAPTGVVRGGEPSDDPTFRAPDCVASPESPACMNLRFHPQGWEAASASGNPDHHARFARRNVQACTACHREESCLRCHATTASQGRGVSPHPPGFQARCGAMAARNARACAKCHAGLPEACR